MKKIVLFLGIALLLVMAILHASGFYYVTKLFRQTNAPTFLQAVFPILFLFPSIQLLGLAAFALLSNYLGEGARQVLWVTTILVMVNAGLAFVLQAWLPGVLLLIASSCLGWAARLS